MISLFLVFFICIIKISFIKTQEIVTNIDVNCNNVNNNDRDTMIYNSIIYNYEICDSRIINQNICYSGTSRSLYVAGITYSEQQQPCNNGQKPTELDYDGYWLGNLECVYINDDFSYMSDIIIENNNRIQFDSISNSEITFSLYILGNSNKKNPTEITNALNPQPLVLANLRGNELTNFYKYYYDSCINHFYEQSCQYVANLCTLAMFDPNNIFCKYIDILNQRLQSNERNQELGTISNLLNFSDVNTKQLLATNINIQTSFDKLDNKIHINSINLYLAK